MVFLQSWWVASELIRRHPELELVETQPGDGQNDCLTVLGAEGPDGLYVDLNRNGSMNVRSEISNRFDRTLWNIQYPVDWSAELGQENRRLVPLFLEEAAGLHAPSQTPATTQKTLVFRIIYYLLLFSLNEPADWDARNGYLDFTDMGSGNERPYFDEIQSAQIALRQSRPQGWKASAPRYDFWGVLRDGRCLGLIQINGTLHRPNTDPVNLMKIYNSNKRDILPTSMQVRELLTS